MDRKVVKNLLRRQEESSKFQTPLIFAWVILGEIRTPWKLKFSREQQTEKLLMKPFELEAAGHKDRICLFWNTKMGLDTENCLLRKFLKMNGNPFESRAPNFCWALDGKFNDAVFPASLLQQIKLCKTFNTELKKVRNVCKNIIYGSNQEGILTFPTAFLFSTKSWENENIFSKQICWFWMFLWRRYFYPTSNHFSNSPRKYLYQKA